MNFKIQYFNENDEQVTFVANQISYIIIGNYKISVRSGERQIYHKKSWANVKDIIKK